MSFVVTTPEIVAAAAENLAGIGTTLAKATASAAGPTTEVAAAAADEVSIAISQLFGTYAQEFQAVSAQAATFQDQFVRLLTGGAAAYLNTEIANVEQNLGNAMNTPTQALLGLSERIETLPALWTPGAAATVPGGAYQQLFANTAANLQALESAWAAHPFPFLSQLIANQQGYWQQIAMAFARTIQNFPADLANLPAAIQAGIEQLLAFPVAFYTQQFIATQLGFAQTIGTHLYDLGSEIVAGLPNYSAGLQLALSNLAAGKYSDALAEFAKAHANLLVTGVDNSDITYSVVGTSFHITAKPKLLGPLGHLFTIDDVPGQEAQYLTNLMPPGSIPRHMAQNFTNVLNTLAVPSITGDVALNLSPLGVEFNAFFGLPLVLTYAVAGPPVATLNALATSATSIQQALASGNGMAAIGALGDVPAVAVDGFLNGHYIMDQRIPMPLPPPFTQTIAIVLHLPFDGILVAPHPVTATVDLRPIGADPVDLTIRGTPFSGLVPLLVNYIPQQLAKAITPTG
ncbi:PE family protein [Mycobacterium riyadhense]|uniref:PE domain-containing protein n=1 Tax=Mycobacterium riyadhense TaxID=486698 RepID=A0A1X2BR12_9MYCO|nr:PE family protein [Mycobacterium riyadhense]MCV7148697.1 PE family protein [Mycobacterium riyadhense]ORW66024.1 hypothetical protein AWC22_02380 [Mycobacterium riyadhense]